MRIINKHQKIEIHKAENGFQVTRLDESPMKSSTIFVYNDYRDLLRDMCDFLSKEEEEETIEERIDREIEKRIEEEMMEE